MSAAGQNDLFHTKQRLQADIVPPVLSREQIGDPRQRK